MNYLIAVLSNRIQAEAAYSALEEANLPMEKISILGKGYKSIDDFSFIDPANPTRKQMRQMATWLIPFGLFAGTTFSFITNLDTFAWAGEVGNHLIGGVLGAIAGALGSFVAGGGLIATIVRDDGLSYRSRLNDGKYLVVVTGAENVTLRATGILRQLEPENLQGSVEPDGI